MDRSVHLEDKKSKDKLVSFSWFFFSSSFYHSIFRPRDLSSFTVYGLSRSLLFVSHPYTDTYIFFVLVGKKRTMSSRLDPRYRCLSSPWVRFFSLSLLVLLLQIVSVFIAFDVLLDVIYLFFFSKRVHILILLQLLLLLSFFFFFVCVYTNTYLYYIYISPYPSSSVDNSFLWWWDQQHILFVHLSISIRMHISDFLLRSIVHSHTPRPWCSLTNFLDRCTNANETLIFACFLPFLSHSLPPSSSVMCAFQTLVHWVEETAREPDTDNKWIDVGVMTSLE